MNATRLLLVLALVLPWMAASANPAQPTPYWQNYPLQPAAGYIDLAVQPLGMPAAVFGELLRRDRILSEQLGQQGLTLRVHPYHKGSDILQQLADIEGAFLGDMPTLNALARQEHRAVAMVKMTYSRLVSRQTSTLEALRGQRIAYAHGSSAHYTLLQGLASVGLAATDVVLTPMNVADMPPALERGEIDAFCAWEPAPTVALQAHPDYRVLYQGLSTDYFVVSESLLQEHPDTALTLIAAYVRALHHLRRSDRNIERAVRWTISAGNTFLGRPQIVSVEQGRHIVRREMLDVPGAPAIPPGLLEDDNLLAREFAFLNTLGSLPAGAGWPQVRQRFDLAPLQQILASEARWRWRHHDYRPD